MEVIGALAAASQLVAYALKVLANLKERINDAPGRIKDSREQLGQLEMIISLIEKNNQLLTEEVSSVVAEMATKVVQITNLLPPTAPNTVVESSRPENTRKRMRMARIRAIGHAATRSITLRNTVNHDIDEKFADLEKSKTNLILLISVVSHGEMPSMLDNQTSKS